jgi:hypothetical protein
MIFFSILFAILFFFVIFVTEMDNYHILCHL